MFDNQKVQKYIFLLQDVVYKNIYLKNNQNAHIHEFNRQNHNVRISTWHYNEYVIWGLTAMIAAEFINTCFDGNVIADMDLIRKGNVNKYR